MLLAVVTFAVAAEEPWVIHFGESASVRHSDRRDYQQAEARASSEAASRSASTATAWR